MYPLASRCSNRRRDKSGLLMPLGSSACYRLYIPARAKFLTHIALMPDTRGKYYQRVAFEVEVLEYGGSIKIKRKKLIDPSRFNGDPKWIKFCVGLRRLANREV